MIKIVVVAMIMVREELSYRKLPKSWHCHDWRDPPPLTPILACTLVDLVLVR